MKFNIRCNGKQFNSLCEHIAGAIYEAKDILAREQVTEAQIYDEGVEGRPRAVITEKADEAISQRGTMKDLFGG